MSQKMGDTHSAQVFNVTVAEAKGRGEITCCLCKNLALPRKI